MVNQEQEVSVLSLLARKDVVETNAKSRAFWTFDTRTTHQSESGVLCEEIADKTGRNWLVPRENGYTVQDLGNEQAVMFGVNACFAGVIDFQGKGNSKLQRILAHSNPFERIPTEELSVGSKSPFELMTERDLCGAKVKVLKFVFRSELGKTAAVRVAESFMRKRYPDATVILKPVSFGRDFDLQTVGGETTCWPAGKAEGGIVV